MSIKIKICGITNIADALAAAHAGADCLGFIFYPKSPRYVTPETVADIVVRLPGNILKVGVFVNESAATIEKIVKKCGLNIIQLHGEEPPETAQVIGPERVWKVIRLNGAATAPGSAALNYPADAVVIDSASGDIKGGSGVVCDWQRAAAVAAIRKTVLAGGITPENIAAAAAAVKPFAIDVCSGSETAPGRKDHAKINALINNLNNQRKGIL